MAYCSDLFPPQHHYSSLARYSPPSTSSSLTYYDQQWSVPNNAPTDYRRHSLFPQTSSTPDPSSPSADSSSQSRHSSSSPPASVKKEPDDGCFIMELAAPHSQTSLLAPPTEAPLRATQATPEMRKMMSVFRLNPFAIHNGAAAIPAYHETAHPLDSEPVMFEFQLDIRGLNLLDHEDTCNDALGLGNIENQGLRSFSPDFELHDDCEGQPVADDVDQSDPGELWSSCVPQDNSQNQRLENWELSYPEPEDRFSPMSSASAPTYPNSHRQPRLHNNYLPQHPAISHPYLAKASPQSAGDSTYPNAGIHAVNGQQALLSHHHQHPYLDRTTTHPMSASNTLEAQAHHGHLHHTPQWPMSSSSLRSMSLSGAGYHHDHSNPNTNTLAHATSNPPSRSNHYALSATSPNPAVNHSFVPLRRWSLPDAHPSATGPFLM